MNWTTILLYAFGTWFALVGMIATIIVLASFVAD